jgi:K+/H+ antiporter YhaU regulatory subunit KhtT
MDVHVRQQRLPGIGRLYTMTLPNGVVVRVAVGRDGARELSIARPGDEDPWAAVALDEAHATTLAALLTGAQFVVEDVASVADDTAMVDTVTVGPGSPLVGRSIAEVTLPGHDTTVLAIIRDQTPDLVEDEDQPIRPGDRLVIATRPSVLPELRRELTG